MSVNYWSRKSHGYANKAQFDFEQPDFGPTETHNLHKNLGLMSPMSEADFA